MILTALVCTLGVLAVPAAPAAAAESCVAVRFIAVRGSGEAGAPTGNAANDIYNAMKAYVPGGTTTALTGIDYAAVGMDKTGIGKTIGTLGWRYQSSKSGGVRNLDAYLDEQASCTSERWVLLGFSQGAHVVGDALSSEDGTLDAAQQSKLAGVVLLADPRFNPQETFVAGTFSVARYGLERVLTGAPNVVRDAARRQLAGKRPKGDLARAVGKIRSWCDADDFVCQGVGTDNDNAVHSGTRYVSAHKDAITSFLRGKLGWSSTSGGTPSGYTGPIDVAFTIDTTGSMGDDIARVSSAAIDLFNKLKSSGADARVALVDYKDTDQGDPYGARLDLPFTSDATAFSNAVGGLSVSGGGDYPEAVLSGIQKTIDGLSWRNGAKKIIISLGDAPGKDPEPVTGLTTASVLKAAYDLDPAQIYPIVLDASATPFFQRLADGSAGELFSVSDPTTVVDVLGKALLSAVSAPVAVLSPVAPARPGTEVTFSAADSYAPNGEALVSFAWDFDGNGSVDRTTDTPFATHIYDSPFTGTAAVTVTSETGAMATGSAAVTVTADESVAPSAVPGPVIGLAATALDMRVDVSWTAPSGRVDSYTVTVTEDGSAEPVAVGVTPDPAITFTDATPGRYTVTVAAVNGAGTGPALSVPVTVGEQPDAVTLDFTDSRGQVTTWGGTISHGDVRLSPHGAGPVLTVRGYAALADDPQTTLLMRATKTRFAWAGMLHARRWVRGPDARISAVLTSVRRTGATSAVISGSGVLITAGRPEHGKVTVMVSDAVRTALLRAPKR